MEKQIIKLSGVQLLEIIPLYDQHYKIKSSTSIVWRSYLLEMKSTKIESSSSTIVSWTGHL